MEGTNRNPCLKALLSAHVLIRKANAHGGWQAPSGQNQKSAPPAPVHTGPLFPHPILFLENLPLDITSDDVAAVFSPVL